MIDWTVKENRFLLGDCMDYMATMPDKCFDLAICDVQYGIGASNYARGGTQYGNSKIACNIYEIKQWDNEPPSPFYFSELFRVTKHQIIWGANHFISRLPQKNQDSSGWINWDKDNGENGYADCELAYSSFDCAVRKVKWKWHGMLQQDMKNKECRIHPTQKPVALYRWLLKNYAKPGWTILDTHGGSGSSVIACETEGFTYTWIEKDEDYYRDAKKRIKQWREGRTLDMFEEPKNDIGVQSKIKL